MSPDRLTVSNGYGANASLRLRERQLVILRQPCHRGHALRRAGSIPDTTVTTPPLTDDTDPQSASFFAGLIAVLFVMNAIGRGVTETFAVFLLPVERDLGVNRATISATYSIYMLGYGFAAPFAGQLIDRYGARVCYGTGLASLALGYWIGGGAQSIWQYYFGVGVLGGIGAAALGMVAASSLLARWFTERLGSVSAVPYAAVGAGMILFAPVAQVLIDAYGWRHAHRILAGFTTVALLLVVVLPLGRYSAGSKIWQAKRAKAAATSTTWTATAAVRTGAFWMLFLAYFATAVAAYSVLPHSVAFLVEQGFDPLVAASAFGFNGVMSVIGILAIGWLSDRWGRTPAVTLSYMSSIIGIGSLLSVTLWPSTVLVYMFVFFFGLMQGARGPILVALVSRIFAGGSVGTIFGVLSVALGTGAATGSFLAGVLHEWTGNYVAAFLLAMASCGVGMATFWFAPSVRQERVIKRFGVAHERS